MRKAALVLWFVFLTIVALVIVILSPIVILADCFIYKLKYWPTLVTFWGEIVNFVHDLWFEDMYW